MPTKRTPYTKTFIKNACALEEKLHGFNIPAAFNYLREQKKVNTALFYPWLFTKYSGYPAHGVAVANEVGPSIYISLSAATYLKTRRTYLRCGEDDGVLELIIDSKGHQVSSHMFLEVFQDMCYKFKAHVAEQYRLEYTELLMKCQTLRVPFPCVQVQVAVPDYDVHPSLRPSLLLFRDRGSSEFVKLSITKKQGEAIAALNMEK